MAKFCIASTVYVIIENQVSVRRPSILRPWYFRISILSVSLRPHKVSRQHRGGRLGGWHGGQHGGAHGGRHGGRHVCRHSGQKLRVSYLTRRRRVLNLATRRKRVPNLVPFPENERWVLDSMTRVCPNSFPQHATQNPVNVCVLWFLYWQLLVEDLQHIWYTNTVLA